MCPWKLEKESLVYSMKLNVCFVIAEITYVGIHNRRTDHLEFIRKTADLKPLQNDYFYDAMEYFRYTGFTGVHATWGRYHKSWVQGANHRDNSIHLRPRPTPNFLRSFLHAQKFSARAIGCKKNYEIDPWLLVGVCGWGVNVTESLSFIKNWLGGWGMIITTLLLVVSHEPRIILHL